MSSLTIAPALVRINPVVRDVALVGGGVVAMGALAQLTLPLPFTPVPVTGQTFGALLIGGAFGWMRASVTMTLYLLVGAVGAPVFAGGVGGAAIFSSPSAGYLVGMLLAAALVGWTAGRGWDRRLGSSVAAMLVGSVIIYAFGAAWLAVSLHIDAAEAYRLGVRPFLIGDALKLMLAGATLPTSWSLLRRYGSQ